MKKTLLSALIVVAAVAFGPFAVADNGMGHGQMMSGQSTASMSQMHQQMQGMQSQMQMIHSTNNSQERSQLMHDHLQSMRESLKMMGTMQQPNMHSGSADEAPMMRCTGENAECRQMNQMAEQQQQMQQRMSMMQMMMQQIVEHEAAAEQNTSE